MATPSRQHGAGTLLQGPRLTGAQVWRQIDQSSFAVISYTTPAGQPRSSGVLYAADGQRLYVVVANDSWKARHIAVSGRVAVTVTGAPGRDPLAAGAHPARHDQFPRHRDRPCGQLGGDRLPA